MGQRAKRAEKIFSEHYQKLAYKTDRMFSVLFLFQWLLGIVFSIWLSPLTWAGSESQIHIHIYSAVFLGGILAWFPIYLTLSRPGHPFNKYIIATSQILFSGLFIHLTGGRIETHFHIFGSLAFLAFYRDFRPILLATVITAADHLLRGYYWPESVYGVLFATPYRALEHAAWVLFEDAFLFVSMKNGLDELKTIAHHQADLEHTLQDVEKLVSERTFELKESQEKVLEQQQTLITTSKMSSLGEMAGGIAHEINTPLAVVSMRVEQLTECLEEGDFESLDLKENLILIKKTTDRIAKIVNGLRFFAREGRQGQPENVKIATLIEDTLSLCLERFANHGVTLHMEKEEGYENLELECHPVEISQVLLNLLNNAHDAIQQNEEKWVQISIKDQLDWIQVSVTDSGSGIPQEVQKKIMQPFFTTKEIGKGTGLGLSISKGIVESHHGQFFIDNKSKNTRFTIRLPKKMKAEGAKNSAA